MTTRLNKNSSDIESEADSFILEVEATQTSGRDPRNAKKIALNTDYYTLTWACLQKHIYDRKKIRGVLINLLPVDYFNLYLEFLAFSIMIFATLILVIREAVLYDEYIEGTFDIIIYRCILMVYALVSMGPEFEDGYAKYLYTLKNPTLFTYPGFAKFVALDQLINAGVTLTTVLFFVCTADTPADLLTNFSGLCVLSELDDWIGEAILANQVVRKKYYLSKYEEEEKEIYRKKNEVVNSKYDLKQLNERLNVIEKMSLLEEEDLVIFFNEKVTESAHWTIKYFDYINKIVPWYALIGLSTIPLSYGMPFFTTHARHLFGITKEDLEEAQS